MYPIFQSSLRLRVLVSKLNLYNEVSATRANCSLGLCSPSSAPGNKCGRGESSQAPRWSSATSAGDPVRSGKTLQESAPASCTPPACRKEGKKSSGDIRSSPKILKIQYSIFLGNTNTFYHITLYFLLSAFLSK